jgi:hypothetical protein
MSQHTSLVGCLGLPHVRPLQRANLLPSLSVASYSLVLIYHAARSLLYFLLSIRKFFPQQSFVNTIYNTQHITTLNISKSTYPHHHHNEDLILRHRSRPPLNLLRRHRGAPTQRNHNPISFHNGT